MQVIAIRNRNEDTDVCEMIDLMKEKTVWGSVHIDFFHEGWRRPNEIFNALRDGKPTKLEITLAVDQ